MSMSADTKWDLYQAKDKGPFWGPPAPAPIGSGQDMPRRRKRPGWKPKKRKRMGAGGERGMGAGGVYVRAPDGSMHWDETKADPNPNGGSVIDSRTGAVVPGANRQSGSTGPGGTGAPGSQARDLHAQELQQNPSFASDTGPGSMLALGANNLQNYNAGGVGSALMAGALGKSPYTPDTPGPGLTVAQTTGNVIADPALRKMKEDYDAWQRATWKAGSSLGHVGGQSEWPGAGGEEGMGAGGVYVRSKDGSMHWDETKADPNPNGGSVIDAGSGKAIPGANRQSGSTGPGGTGAPGTQARQAHVDMLQANPSFASDTGIGSMLVAGANNLAPAPDTVGTALAGSAAGTGFAPPSPGGTPGLLNTNPSATNAITDPNLKKMKEDYDAFQRNTWKVGSSLGQVGNQGAGADMGAGATTTTTPDTGTVGSVLGTGFTPSTVSTNPSSSTTGLSTTTNPELQSLKEKYDQQQRKSWQVGSSLGKGVSGMGTGGEGGMGAGDTAAMTPSQQASVDLTNKQLDNLMKQAQMEDAQKRDAENNRHNEALAKIQQDYQFHQDDVLLKQQEDAETRRHAVAAEQLQRDQIASNERIEQMREAHEIQIQQMQEGNAIYLQQGQQAYDSWSKGQDQRMQILGSALSNPWLQQLSGMSPTPGSAPGTVTGGKNLANLINQIMQPYDPRAWGVQNAPSVMGLQGSTAGGPAGPAGGGQPNFLNTSTSTLDGTPSWQQWQQMSPWQKAAYRTDLEALGPGVWNQMSSALGSQFTAQGGTPNVTQMQAANADPAGQAGMQMTGELYGQSAPQFWGNQQKMWSGAKAPSVKTGLGGQQQGLSGIAS